VCADKPEHFSHGDDVNLLRSPLFALDEVSFASTLNDQVHSAVGLCTSPLPNFVSAVRKGVRNNFLEVLPTHAVDQFRRIARRLIEKTPSPPSQEKPRQAAQDQDWRNDEAQQSCEGAKDDEAPAALHEGCTGQAAGDPALGQVLEERPYSRRASQRDQPMHSGRKGK
jgi:hypothetical protein